MDNGKKANLRLRDRLPAIYRWVGSLLLILSLTLVLAPDFQLPITNMTLGDVSSSNIKAKKDFLIEDTISTRKNKDLARNATPSVYDFDLKPLEAFSTRIQKAFAHMEEFYNSNIPGFYQEMEEVESVLEAADEEYSVEQKGQKRLRKAELNEEAKKWHTNPSFEGREKEFIETLGVKLDQKSLRTLRWHHYNPKIARGLTNLLADIFKKGIVGNRDLLQTFKKNGIIARELNTENSRPMKNIDNILDVGGLQNYAKENISKYIDPMHTSLQKVVLKIVDKPLQPNLTFNKQETEALKKKAEESVKPVFFNIKKGEMIVREGERIGNAQLQKLMAMNKENKIQDYLLSVLGIFLFLSLIFTLTWYYILHYRQDIASNGKNLLLLGTILLINSLIFGLLVHFSQPLAVYLQAPLESIYFAIPFAAGPMLTALLFDLDIGILLAIMNCVVVGARLEWDLSYCLVALAGGLFAVLRKNFYKQRSSILKNGVYIGFLNVAIIVPLNLVEYSLAYPKSLYDISAGFVGGIMVTLVASWLLPAFESVFRVNSDIKLQEICNLNHPLLRKMIVEAPGSYHHSIVVSTLAEGAAEVVGANPLVVRVGSYYHDIGKMKKPLYFIENQKKGHNRHDKLSPSMSSLVVLSHVREGVELAKAHKLNPVIIDFIKEHHGTSLMKYFYNKAKEKGRPGTDSIEEAPYRYVGPKPQTKETAIVLLADSVEAAARSLPEPSVCRLQGLVEKIINEKLIDGELEECDLTLKDLNNIGRVFVGILTGIFHSRIEYPEQKEDLAARDFIKKKGRSL